MLVLLGDELRRFALRFIHSHSGATGVFWRKAIKKKKNSTQNKSQTQRARAYKVTSFLSTDCELSTEMCSKNVYSLGPGQIVVLYTSGWSQADRRE